MVRMKLGSTAMQPSFRLLGWLLLVQLGLGLVNLMMQLRKDHQSGGGRRISIVPSEGGIR